MLIWLVLAHQHAQERKVKRTCETLSKLGRIGWEEEELQVDSTRTGWVTVLQMRL